MNFPSVHEGGRKRGERTKAPWSSPSLYIPRSLYFHTPISLPLDRQFHFSIPLSSSRACTNEACNCTGLPCTGEKNIVIRQGLFADRGGGGEGRTRIEIEWEVALFPRIPCSPPPPPTGRADYNVNGSGRSAVFSQGVKRFLSGSSDDQTN